jgi:hypothetical protein
MANDAKLRFADATSIAANAAASVDPVGNVLDLWNATTNPGKTFWPDDQVDANDLGDNDLVWEAQVTTALAGSGAVLTLSIYNHTAATSLSSGHKVATIVKTVPAGGIAAGSFLVRMPLQAGQITKRYLAVVSEVATQNLTAGSIDSCLTTVKEYNAAHGSNAVVA